MCYQRITGSWLLGSKHRGFTCHVKVTMSLKQCLIYFMNLDLDIDEFY